MYTNEVLEEAWRVKDELDREAEGDLDKFCEQLAEWAKQNPFRDRAIHHPGGVRAYFDELEKSAASVQEEPKKYGE